MKFTDLGRGGSPGSRLQLPPGAWTTLIDGLCARFPAIDRAAWLDRFARGRVLDAQGQALAADAAYRVGMEIRYFREARDEPAVSFEIPVLHVGSEANTTELKSL